MKVEFEDGVLTVEGERSQEKEEKGKTFHKIERGYGKFVRRFALPTEVDATKVSAEFKEGVLNVHLPKSANARRPKAIAGQGDVDRCAKGCLIAPGIDLAQILYERGEGSERRVDSDPDNRSARHRFFSTRRS